MGPFAHSYIRIFADSRIRTFAHSHISFLPIRHSDRPRIRTFAHKFLTDPPFGPPKNSHIRTFAYSHIRTFARSHVRTFAHKILTDFPAIWVLGTRWYPKPAIAKYVNKRFLPILPPFGFFGVLGGTQNLRSLKCGKMKESHFRGFEFRCWGLGFHLVPKNPNP